MKAILLRPAARNYLPVRRFARPTFSLLIVFWACTLGAAAFQSGSSGTQKQAVDAQAYRIRAAAQYELIDLYLNNGEPDKATAAARMILQPPIPPEYEEAVVKSMGNISDKLKSMRRFDLAQPLLDEALKAIVQIPRRVELFRMKAALYYLAGEDDKAIDAWRRAEAEKNRQREEN
jgi:tetratricopeptide (TPR) repeat protein